MTGTLPRIIPLLITIPSPPSSNSEVTNTIADAHVVLQQLEDDVQATKDNLLLAKITQAAQKNKGHSAEKPYTIGDKVMLSTFHQWRDYVQKTQNHVANFMLRFDGPYMITEAFPICSVYTIHMPNSTDLYSCFYTALLKPFVPNDQLSLHMCVHILVL